MAIQKQVFERVLNMAQMHNIGVLEREPGTLWTCRWNEGGRESSITYQLVLNRVDQSLKLRLRYQVIQGADKNPLNLDYTVPIKTSTSYKLKKWFWFACPLVINGHACKRRVRSLYFLPNSHYFGCKYCRDMMVRSLPIKSQQFFHQTQAVSLNRQATNQERAFIPELRLGWRPAPSRRICRKCGCLSEGLYCCNCGQTVTPEKAESPFELLGVSEHASGEEIRAAFHDRIKEYHPDRVAHLGKKIREVAEAEVKRIYRAYEILKDPARREAMVSSERRTA